MPDKKAYKFELDKPTKVVLLYDKPKTGKSQYGEWNLYGAEINGEQTSFFASTKLHQDIKEKGFKKGSTFTITLKAGKSEDGKLFQYYEIDEGNTPIKKFENELIGEKAIEKKDKQDEVWEKKDKLMSAMSALKAASVIFEGSGHPSGTILKQAKKYYDWLQACKENVEDLFMDKNNK